MKTNKSKSTKNSSKKNAKKQLEKTLSERFFEVVRGLGHNAETIAQDVAKLSKSAAKKLVKKFDDLKSGAENQLESGSEKAKKGAVKKVKLGKKATHQLAKKVDRSISKAVEKAVKNTTPAIASVKVDGISSADKAKKAIDVQSGTAAGAAKSTVESTPKQEVQKSASKTKPATSNTGSKQSVVKAVTNNPVEKVEKSQIPTKKIVKPTTKK